MPLWNATFSPTAERLGIIDWFTILLGLISVLALTMHGATWIILKTNSSLNARLRQIVYFLNFGLLLLIVISVLLWHNVEPEPFHNFLETPWYGVFPLLMLTGLFGLFGVRSFVSDGWGFIFSSMFLFGGLSSTAVSIFPNVLPSTNEINASLTLYNSASDHYGLSVGIAWFSAAAVLVVLYFILQYRVFRGKMDHLEYGEH